MANLVAGANQTAAVPVKVIPSGLPCGAQVFLTLDAAGANVKAQSVIFSFVSTGSLQLVAVPLVAPAAGTYYVFVAIYINGIDVGVWASGTVVVIATAVEITNITVNPTSLTSARGEYETSLGLGFWGDPFTISITYYNPFDFEIWARPDFAFGRLTGEPLEYVDGVLQGFNAEELLYFRLLFNTEYIQGDYSHPTAWQQPWDPRGQNIGSNMQFVYDPDGVPRPQTGDERWIKIPAGGSVTMVKEAHLSDSLSVNANQCVLCGEIITGSVEAHYASNHPGVAITCWTWEGMSGCYFDDGSGSAVTTVRIPAPGIAGPHDLCVVANEALYFAYDPGCGQLRLGTGWVTLNWRLEELPLVAVAVQNQINIT